MGAKRGSALRIIGGLFIKEDHDLVVFNVVDHRGSVLRIGLQMLQSPSLLEVAFVLEQQRDECEALRVRYRVKSQVVGKLFIVILAYRACYFVPSKSQQVAQPEEEQYNWEIALLFLEPLLVVETPNTSLFRSQLADKKNIDRGLEDE